MLQYLYQPPSPKHVFRRNEYPWLYEWARVRSFGGDDLCYMTCWAELDFVFARSRPLYTVTGRVGSVTTSAVKSLDASAKSLDASAKYFGRVGEIFWTRRRNPWTHRRNIWNFPRRRDVLDASSKTSRRRVQTSRRRVQGFDPAVATNSF